MDDDKDVIVFSNDDVKAAKSEVIVIDCEQQPGWKITENERQISFDNHQHDSLSQPLPSLLPFQRAVPTFPDTSTSSSISIMPSISDEAFMESKRRKRTQEEIKAEKVAKQEERQRKLQEKAEKKKQNELEKQMMKFDRDVAAAKKSKCEQNLFCFISIDLLGSLENFGEIVTKVFEERNLHHQLLFDGSGMRICWKRKVLEGEIENGIFVRNEKLIYEPFCILSITAQYYSEFKSVEKLAEFVAQALQKFPFPLPRLTIIVFGMLKLRKATVANFVLEAFERYRVQTRFLLTVEEYAVLIAQMHRSIARNDRRHVEMQNWPIVDIEKGITEGDNASVVSDWWLKMLSQMYRMGVDAQRTIATTFPNPHALLDLLKNIPVKDGIKLLADTRIDHGRKIGPGLARKIYVMMTSLDGTETIDEC